MITAHKLEAIHFNNDFLILTIDGNELTIPIDQLSAKLQAATGVEREMYRISPSGYGIHWPLIDEDLSVNGILRDFAK